MVLEPNAPRQPIARNASGAYIPNQRFRSSTIMLNLIFCSPSILKKIEDEILAESGSVSNDSLTEEELAEYSTIYQNTAGHNGNWHKAVNKAAKPILKRFPDLRTQGNYLMMLVSVEGGRKKKLNLKVRNFFQLIIPTISNCFEKKRRALLDQRFWIQCNLSKILLNNC